jgi:hypothetical protein
MLPERYLLIEIEIRETDSRILRFAPVPNDDQWSNRLVSLRALIEAAVA